MRHAKAEQFAPSDHQRTLTERGRRDATAAGLHLAGTGVVPDYAVVSSAARTAETWSAVADASRSTADPVFDDAVYTGSPDVVLEALRVVPSGVRTLIFVGHNPTAAYLAHLIEDGTGEAAATEQLLRGYPTSAMAIMEVEAPWEKLGPEAGRLVDFHVGRG